MNPTATATPRNTATLDLTMKMAAAKRYLRCRRCGGKIIRSYGDLECSVCSAPYYSTADLLRIAQGRDTMR